MRDLKTVENQLKQFLPIIEQKTQANIAMGGCCLFAILLAKQLKKLDIPFKIKAFVDEADPFTSKVNFKDDVDNNSGNSFVFCHVFVEVDGIKFDSDGVVDEYSCFGHLEELSLEEAELMWKTHGWNDCFDREKIPEIEEMMSGLSKVIN